MVEFVAEFTTNHMGNLNLLLKMAEVAKESGADWIKMQRKDVDTFYSQEKLDREYDSPYGKTYGDYRRMFEFSYEQMHLFNAKCMELDIPWFSTVQDITSLLWYEEHFDLPRYKISSSKSHDVEFIANFLHLVPKDKEVVISVAGQSLDGINWLMKKFSEYKKVYILHCVAEYPCKFSSAHLGNILEIKELAKKYDNIHVGYSGHEQGIIPSLRAVALGAEMVERHFALSTKSFVHHIDCSLEPFDFSLMVETAKITGGYNHNKGAISVLDTVSFGMSTMEKSFLVDQIYGDDYLGKESKI